MSKVRIIEPEGFSDLWALWRDYARKTDGRGKARPTYRKWLLEGADPADILDGARWHIRSMKDDERPFIQLLSVYLNSEKWMDECEKERAYQARLSGMEQSTNVVSMKPAPRPANHFLSKLERGEVTLASGE